MLLDGTQGAFGALLRWVWRGPGCLSLEIIGFGIQLAMTEKTEKLFKDRFMTRFITFQNRSA